MATKVLTAAQMRAIEQAAIASGEVTGLELMERAGRGVVEAVFEQWPQLAQAPHRAVVLCGPGNNGGDGFVVARLLKEWGWEVEVFLYGDPEKLPPDAKVNYERWLELGGVLSADQLRACSPWPKFDADCLEKTVFFDALFGTGLTRPIPAKLAEVAFALNDRNLPGRDASWIVSIDVPSGLCADSGKVIGANPDAVFLSDLTVSFHAKKVGHVLASVAQANRKVVVAGIGLEGSLRPQVGEKLSPEGAVGGCPAVPPGEVVHLVETPNSNQLAKKTSDHKYSNGHALILSGPPGTGGAARLAARGALRIGAGLVSVACDNATVPEHAAQLTTIMIKPANGAGELAALLDDPRLNALCIGPGLGLERARKLVPVVLTAPRGEAQKRSVVLDADALTAFGDAPDDLFTLLNENCVLTPHGGEFRRLFPDIAEKLDAIPIQGPAYSKVDATREAAARAGCTVLFKGPETVIAEPGGRASINSAHYDRAAPWLATAGAGDVLAGFITGLLARGFAPMSAAETAAWMHVECALAFGPGLIAEDLSEQVPGVLRKLGV